MASVQQPDTGAYWYQLPSNEWVQVYIAAGMLYRLAPMGDGLPLEVCGGSLHGPLVQPMNPK